MGQRVPVLQLVHISDVHVCHNYSDRSVAGNSALRLILRNIIERWDAFGWHEGTLDHDETAETPFEAFLHELKSTADQWFGDPHTSVAPQTWLVDTGDLTTFGDPGSMTAGHEKLSRWLGLLGRCNARLIFGNHDAWPGTQPAIVRGDWTARIQVQRSRIGEFGPWRTERWLDPLSVDVPGSNDRIELYALDSVRDGWWEGVRAVGSLEDEALERLRRQAIGLQGRRKGRAYRILAAHHPIVFPYTKLEARVVKHLPAPEAMKLTDARKVLDALKNDVHPGATSDVIPLIHLMLAGHTHLGFPAEPLPANVKEGRKGSLAKKQLQLVGGPLMLIRDGAELRGNVPRGGLVERRRRKKFDQSSVFTADAQFQVLRFSRDADIRDGLVMERRVYARLPNDGNYRPYSKLSAECVVLF